MFFLYYGRRVLQKKKAKGRRMKTLDYFHNFRFLKKYRVSMEIDTDVEPRPKTENWINLNPDRYNLI